MDPSSSNLREDKFFTNDRPVVNAMMNPLDQRYLHTMIGMENDSLNRNMPNRMYGERFSYNNVVPNTIPVANIPNNIPSIPILDKTKVRYFI